MEVPSEENANLMYDDNANNNEESRSSSNPSIPVDHIEEYNNGRDTQRKETSQQHKEKVTLNSRTNQKRVIIDEHPSVVNIDPLENAVDYLENKFIAGVTELRHEIAKLRREKERIHAENSDLHQQLAELSGNCQHYQQVIDGMKEELNNAQEQSKSHAENSNKYKDSFDRLSFDHNQQMKNIAHNLNGRRLAKKSFSKWKNISVTKSKYALELENKKLKQELLLCQEAAKNAFVKSAIALNSHALNMFQDTATRRIGFEKIDGAFTSEQDTSSQNSENSEAVIEDFQKRTENNVKDYKQESTTLNFCKNCHSESIYDICDECVSNRSTNPNRQHQHDRRSYNNPHVLVSSAYSKAHASNNYTDQVYRHKRGSDDNYRSEPKSRDQRHLYKENIPQSLREESRACLQQFKEGTFRKRLNEASDQRLYTLFNKEDGEKMLEAQPLVKPKVIKTNVSNTRDKSKDIFRSTRNKENKHVVYKPCGKTIIIEKHIK